MFKKVCILASLSQQSAIEEAVKHYKSEGCIVDYPIEQHDKTLFEIDYDYICRIASADMVVAIPKCDGTFGESVTYELAVAKYLGKPRGGNYGKVQKFGGEICGRRSKRNNLRQLHT